MSWRADYAAGSNYSLIGGYALRQPRCRACCSQSAVRRTSPRPATSISIITASPSARRGGLRSSGPGRQGAAHRWQRRRGRPGRRLSGALEKRAERLGARCLDGVQPRVHLLRRLGAPLPQRLRDALLSQRESVGPRSAAARLRGELGPGGRLGRLVEHGRLRPRRLRRRRQRRQRDGRGVQLLRPRRLRQARRQRRRSFTGYIHFKDLAPPLPTPTPVAEPTAPVTPPATTLSTGTENKIATPTTFTEITTFGMVPSWSDYTVPNGENEGGIIEQAGESVQVSCVVPGYPSGGNVWWYRTPRIPGQQVLRPRRPLLQRRHRHHDGRTQPARRSSRAALLGQVAPQPTLVEPLDVRQVLVHHRVARGHRFGLQEAAATLGSRTRGALASRPRGGLARGRSRGRGRRCRGRTSGRGASSSGPSGRGRRRRRCGS